MDVRAVSFRPYLEVQTPNPRLHRADTISLSCDGEDINLELDGAPVVATPGGLDGNATGVTGTCPANKS